MTNTLPGYEVPEEELRTCSKCNKTKTLDNFSTGINFGKSRHRHECKSCARYLGKIRTRLRKEHGLPPSGYCCPICVKNEEQLTKLQHGNRKQSVWVVDHCHITDKFKGWLCHKCNRTLGGFEDKIENVRNALKYLTI